MYYKNKTRGSFMLLACFITLLGLALANPSVVQAQNMALQVYSTTDTGQIAMRAADSDMTRSNSVCPVTPITVGQTINGELNDTTDCYYYNESGTNYFNVDVYSFTATAGQQVAITLTSTTFDTWLELYKPNGTLLAYNDDSDAGTNNSRIPPGSGLYTLPVSGTYQIYASSRYSEVTGAYSLSLTGEETVVFNPPTVVTNNASSVTTISGVLNGNITANGGAAITEYGFYWGVSDATPTKVVMGNSNITGTISYILSGLSPGATYYFKAYATNSEGVGYGLVKSFTTAANLPAVVTNDASSVTTTSGVLNGNITANGGGVITEYGFYWGASDATPTKVVTGNSNITGTISHILSGLSPATTYYFKAYAANSAGAGYGIVKSFTTDTVGPQTVLTAPVAEGGPDSAIQVPVKLLSQGNIASLKFDLSFNSDLLTFVSGANGSFTSGCAFTASLYEPGQVRVVIDSPAGSNIPQGEGDVALLTFQVAAGSVKGQNCALALSSVSMSDAAANEIADYSLVNGSFTVVVCAKGDVNSDNLINVQDVVRTVNIILGKITPTDTELCAADVNSDDTINVQDVIRIVNIILGKV